MTNLAIQLLSIGLLTMAAIGLVGYSYIFMVSQAEALRTGLTKSYLLKQVISGWIFVCLACFSLSAMFVLRSKLYLAGWSLVILSLVISSVSALLITINCLTSNFLHKKVGKYFEFKDGKLFLLRKLK